MSAARTDFPANRSRISLVELVVAIVVLGILATIALPACGEYLAQAGQGHAQDAAADFHAREQRSVATSGPACGLASITKCVDAISSGIASIRTSSLNGGTAPPSTGLGDPSCCARAARRSPIGSLQKRF